jgi:hypothetical protein
MPPRQPSASIEVVSALFAEHQRLMDERHDENRETLRKILVQVTDTNGRVNNHETRLQLIETKPDRRIQSQSHGSQIDASQWKVIGYGIGIVLFTVWGVVGALHWCFDLLAKIGSTVTGK